MRWYKLLRCILFPVTVFFEEYIELYYSFNPIYCTSRFCQVEDIRLNFYSFCSFLIFCAILSYIRLLVLFWWAYVPLRKEGNTGVLLPDRWKLKYLPLKIRGVFLRIKLLWNLKLFLNNCKRMNNKELSCTMYYYLKIFDVILLIIQININ